MNITFKSKRELYAVSLGITLLNCGILSILMIMLVSMKGDGLVALDFNGQGELWFELPFVIALATFGFWMMWATTIRGKLETS